MSSNYGFPESHCLNRKLSSECNCGSTFRRRYVQEHGRRCPITKKMDAGEQKRYAKELISSKNKYSTCFLVG